MILKGFIGMAGVAAAAEALKAHALVPSPVQIGPGDTDYDMLVSKFIDLPDYANDGVRRRLLIRKIGIRVFSVELQSIPGDE